MFNRITVDSSGSKSDLCALGEKYGTDKSPYNQNSESNHRHPYTAFYDMLFASMRYKNINFGEMGILNNRSMQCWRDYFPNAKLYGWDFDYKLLLQAKAAGLQNVTYDHMNIFEVDSIERGLQKPSCMFDVLIDDTTHQFNDQIRIAYSAHKFMKEGGLFIIEDIFKSIPDEQFISALAPVTKYYNNITFVTTDHINKDSTGWDNDKLIVFHRNNIH